MSKKNRTVQSYHYLLTSNHNNEKSTRINLFKPKKKNTYQEANYRPKNQTLFVDPKILEEIKQTKITLINDNFSSSNSNKLLLSD